MNKHVLLIILFFVALIVSAIHPHDYFTWILEVFPAMIGFVVLLATYKRFQFTYLTYCFILVHCCILFIGGHYTYAEVPAFNWIKEVFHQSRNNYDRLGHFFQGFVPAMITRELLIRLNIIQKKTWMPFLIVCVCTTISVLYEFIEWFVSVTSGSSGDSFLGSQGDIWDTQEDILSAMIGAICMVVLMAKLQDRVMGKRAGDQVKGATSAP